jgi:hypothetical protein
MVNTWSRKTFTLRTKDETEFCPIVVSATEAQRSYTAKIENQTFQHGGREEHEVVNI